MNSGHSGVASDTLHMNRQNQVCLHVNTTSAIKWINKPILKVNNNGGRVLCIMYLYIYKYIFVETVEGIFKSKRNKTLNGTQIDILITKYFIVNKK